MGTYLNPGGERWRLHTTVTPFVDKTEMLAQLNVLACTEHRYVSVTRPRRFGKTWAADMVCAYFGRGEDMGPVFRDLRIGSCAPRRGALGDLAWDAYLGAFDVVRVTVTDFLAANDTMEDMVADVTDEVTDELLDAYPDVRLGRKRTLQRVLSRVHRKTGRRFVVVIDEWDAPFRERPDDMAGQKHYVEFLNAWLKDQEWIALAYMTGILPIKRYGTHSALNMFDEYSMLAPAQLAPYAGFTEEEVRGLCRRYRFDFAPLKEWYDGYEVRYVGWLEDRVDDVGREAGGGDGGETRYSLYSPLSVTKAIRNRKVGSYWNEGETFLALSDQINRDFDGLKTDVALLMAGGASR